MPEQNPEQPRNVRSSIKGPLVFSAVLGVVAFFAVLIFASGGSARTPRFDLAFIGFGIAFIVALVFAAMLSLTHRDNADYIGSGRLPDGMEHEAPAAAAQMREAQADRESEPDSDSSGQSPKREPGEASQD